MFTEVDVFVTVVLMITTIVAFLRGFLKDIASLLNFGGAAIITLLFYPVTVEITGEVFRESVLINIAAVVLVFASTLILISIFTAMVLDNLRKMRLGVFDRTLGIIYGMLKGFAIVAVLHYGFYIANGQEDPKWLRKGETYGLTKMGSNMIEDWLREEEEKAKDRGDEFDGEPIQPMVDDVEILLEETP